MSRELEVMIYPPLELNHASYFHSGLFELAHQGVISTKMAIMSSPRRGRVAVGNGHELFTDDLEPKTSFYVLGGRRGNKKIRFAVDLNDIPHHFSRYALTHCDFVFKRNYVQAAVDSLSPSYRSKVHPLGLSFMVRSLHARHNLVLLLGFLLINIRSVKNYDRFILRKLGMILKEGWAQWKLVSRTRSVDDFNEWFIPSGNKVFYLKRLLGSMDTEDTRGIYTQRAGMIRYLRSHLGDHFVGGLKPDPLALELFPDCIADTTGEGHEFLRLMRECSIAVYTRGLANSPGWTLPEYLSQGKCIVAEPFETVLPQPLEHQKQAFFFSSYESCLKICNDLIADPEKRKRVGKQARDYYEQYVNPSANVLRILKLMSTSWD